MGEFAIYHIRSPFFAFLMSQTVTCHLNLEIIGGRAEQSDGLLCLHWTQNRAKVSLKGIGHILIHIWKWWWQWTKSTYTLKV